MNTCHALLRPVRAISLVSTPARQLLKRLGMSLSQVKSQVQSNVSGVECHPIRFQSRIATLYEAEWLHILATMAECGGNVSRAARALGLARQSLQRKLRRLPPLSLHANDAAVAR